ASRTQGGFQPHHASLQPKWPHHDPFADRVIEFNNHGVTFGADPLKPRLDIWQSYWEEKK
ncbi:hypothetical protein, partial [Rhizobium johnstonii]|uniref:hypothetical protein n=1 Tax=Rhizobium johnstonii TaxID=3019933 RepID=UPI003F995048